MIYLVWLVICLYMSVWFALCYKVRTAEKLRPAQKILYAALFILSPLTVAVVTILFLLYCVGEFMHWFSKGL